MFRYFRIEKRNNNLDLLYHGNIVSFHTARVNMSRNNLNLLKTFLRHQFQGKKLLFTFLIARNLPKQPRDIWKELMRGRKIGKN